MIPARSLMGIFAVIMSGQAFAAPVVSSAASSPASSASVAPSSTSSSSSVVLSSSVSSSKVQSSASSSASVSSASASATSSAAAPAWTVPAGWKVASNPCIAEGTSGRALSYTSFSSSAMTIESCLAFCDGNGQPLAGLEYSGQCFCGGILGNGASLSASGTCSMTCSGDAGRTCGGPNSLSLYVSTGSSASGLSSDYQSQSTSLPGSWTASGCIAEGKTGRALDGWSYTGSLNVQTCLSYCQSKGFALAGLENGNECWCDNALRNGAGATSTACKTPCNGGPGQMCGGPNALSLYTNPAAVVTTSNGYTKQACIQEVNGRALTGASSASDSMTIASCTSFCSGKGMKYAGLEYGRECYCGNDLVNGASLSAYSTQCVTKCPGKTSQNCGGPNAIALYASS